MRPARTQIILGIRWGPKSSSCWQRRLWSNWADAQADLSLRWAHMPFCWFCHEAALCQQTEAQISLHIRTVWSGPFLFAAYTAWCLQLLDLKFQDYRILPNKCPGRFKKVKKGVLKWNGQIPYGFSNYRIFPKIRWYSTLSSAEYTV